MIIDPFVRREFGSCFYLVIPVCENDKEMRELINDAHQVQIATNSVMNGSMSIEDFLESIEKMVPDIDSYIDEVEANLEETIKWLPTV